MSIASPLLRPLFDGPLDVIGDVHGEFQALRSLLRHLGYDSDGAHPEGRRLVFVGDLTDRGPDSPAVVEFVHSLVDSGRAQCVLGNHDFNIMVDHSKPENKWFYGEQFHAEDGSIIPQVLADASTRQRIRGFLRTLPLALVRNDLRVVHACWDDEMIEVARNSTDFVSLYEKHIVLVEDEIAASDIYQIDKGLLHQNRNPVKLLTSGPEERCEQPFEAGGKVRHERRVEWWKAYDGVFCVFGHYSIPECKPRGDGSAFCVDYGIGKRWTERREGKTNGFSLKLAALRFPEREIVFDVG